MSTVSAISSTTASTATTSTSTASSASSALSMTFDQYIQIMLTQLENQDPTNATDPNQYTQQLITIQNVQQMVQIDKDLQNLVTSLSATGLTSSISYIGKYVECVTNDYSVALQDGSATFGYTLDSAASSSTIKVTDADGKTVATLSGGTASGANYVTWDGKDTDGNTATDGTYYFSVNAVDSAGDAVKVTDPILIAKVTSVQSGKDSTVTLVAGDIGIDSTDVTAVYSTTSEMASATGTSGTSS